jgi:hypothetical protein
MFVAQLAIQRNDLRFRCQCLIREVHYRPVARRYSGARCPQTMRERVVFVVGLTRIGWGRGHAVCSKGRRDRQRRDHRRSRGRCGRGVRRRRPDAHAAAHPHGFQVGAAADLLLRRPLATAAMLRCIVIPRRTRCRRRVGLRGSPGTCSVLVFRFAPIALLLRNKFCTTRPTNKNPRWARKPSLCTTRLPCASCRTRMKRPTRR